MLKIKHLVPATLLALAALAGCGRAFSPEPVAPAADAPRAAAPRALGQELPDSQSIDTPGKGRLEHGQDLRPFLGLNAFIHRGERPYGTVETVQYLVEAGLTVSQAFPGTARVLVRDLSQAGGGYVSGHASHQSGRDADVGYYAAGNEELEHFIDMDERNLDVAKSWLYLKALLATQQVMYVFVDHGLQRLFHAHATAAGERPEFLQWALQYPRPVEQREGVIRHWPNHKNHLHVRFVCPSGDLACKDPTAAAASAP